VGIAFPDMVFGMDVMAEPGHSLLGLMALALGCLPILLWARYTEDTSKFFKLKNNSTSKENFLPEKTVDFVFKNFKSHPFAMALGFLVIAGVIVSLPRTPIDVARPNIKISLPLMIDNQVGVPSPLLPKKNLLHAVRRSSRQGIVWE